MSSDFEKDVQTPATVKPGMGYPNDRVETSLTAIGWQGLDVEELEHVSRETIGEDR
jgi:hypothetical protein